MISAGQNLYQQGSTGYPPGHGGGAMYPQYGGVMPGPSLQQPLFNPTPFSQGGGIDASIELDSSKVDTQSYMNWQLGLQAGGMAGNMLNNLYSYWLASKSLPASKSIPMPLRRCRGSMTQSSGMICRSYGRRGLIRSAMGIAPVLLFFPMTLAWRFMLSIMIRTEPVRLLR